MFFAFNASVDNRNNQPGGEVKISFHQRLIGDVTVSTPPTVDSLCEKVALTESEFEKEVREKVTWAISTVILSSTVPPLVRARFQNIVNEGLVRVSEELGRAIHEVQSAFFAEHPRKKTR